jgi:hypothetical protein
MMRRFYTGLLFFGASFGAHAAEAHKHSHATKPAHVAMHYTLYVPENHELKRAEYSDFKSDGSDISAPQLADSYLSFVALTQGQQNLVNVLSALHLKRMSLQNEEMKLSVRPGSAVMETEHLKVAVQSDSASVTWHQTF